MYIKDKKLITDSKVYSAGDGCWFFMDDRTVISATIAYIPITSNVIYVEQPNDSGQITMIWLEKLNYVESWRE